MTGPKAFDDSIKAMVNLFKETYIDALNSPTKTSWGLPLATHDPCEPSLHSAPYMVPCLGRLFSSKFGAVICGFIVRRQNWSTSVLVVYGTLKLHSCRGFVRVVFHISVPSLVTSANSVFYRAFVNFTPKYFKSLA